MNPLVTIIITTYNRADLLSKRSIPTILNQSYKNLECLVIDDCSTDGTEDVVKEFSGVDKRLHYIRTPKNCGIACARNLGIKKSRGDFIAFLDDEDEFLLDYITEVMKAFLKLPEKIGAVVTHLLIRGKNGYEIKAEPTRIFWQAGIGNGWILRRGIFFEKNLWFDEGLRSLEDLDFALKFSALFDYHIIPKPLFRYYTVMPKFNFKAPLSEKRYRSYFISDFEKIFKRHLSFYKQLGREALAWFYFFKGIHYCQFGIMNEGRTAFFQSLITKPSLKTLYYYLASLGGQRIFLLIYGLKSKLKNL